MLFNAAVISLFTFTPDFLKANGFSIASAGFVTSAVMWPALVLAPVIGYVIDKVDRKRAIIAIGGLALAILVMLVPNAISWMLADIATQLEAARLLTYEAACLADEGAPFTKQAAMAKLYATELCMNAAVQGVQIFGGYGYMMDSPMQRYFRDAKLTTIYEGTSEVQRLVISGQLLK